jgi:hypothetical protein
LGLDHTTRLTFEPTIDCFCWYAGAARLNHVLLLLFKDYLSAMVPNCVAIPAPLDLATQHYDGSHLPTVAPLFLPVYYQCLYLHQEPQRICVAALSRWLRFHWGAASRAACKLEADGTHPNVTL